MTGFPSDLRSWDPDRLAEQIDAASRAAVTPAEDYQRDTHFTFQQPHERPLVGLCGFVADPVQEGRPANGNWPTCVVCLDLLRGIRA